MQNNLYKNIFALRVSQTGHFLYANCNIKKEYKIVRELIILYTWERIVIRVLVLDTLHV